MRYQLKGHKVAHALRANKLAGKPRIVINATDEIVEPMRPRGRPRKNLPDAPFAHYQGQRGTKRPPICLARRCVRSLKMDQRGVCSDDCHDTVFNYALWLLMQIGATKEEINHFYREESIKPVELKAPKGSPTAFELRRARRAAEKLTKGMYGGTTQE